MEQYDKLYKHNTKYHFMCPIITDFLGDISFLRFVFAF